MEYVRAYQIEKWKCYTKKDLDTVKLDSRPNVGNH